MRPRQHLLVKTMVRAVILGVALVATGCGDGATRTTVSEPAQPQPTPPDRMRVDGYRFVRKPLIVDDQRPGEPPDVTVYFRLNRRLPLPGSRGTLDGAEPPEAPVGFAQNRPRCYSQYIGGSRRSPFANKRQGDLATFRLHVRGVRRPLLVTAPLTAPLPVERGPSGLQDPGRAYAQRLGCRRRRS